MALNTRISTQARDVQLNALKAQFDNGYLRIYDSTGGTGQPATPNTAIGSQVLLAELRFAATAFPTVSGGGPLTANAITDDSSADATGTATWYRCLQSDGTTPISDASVGTSGANMNMNSTAIQIGARVSVTSFTHALPMQGA